MTEVLTSTPETSTEDDDDNKAESGSTSSNKKAAKSIGKVSASQALRPPEGFSKPLPKVESLWQKLLVDRKDKNAEPEIITPTRPVIESDDVTSPGQKLKTDAEKDEFPDFVETASDDEASGEEIPVDDLNQSERHMVAREYVADRKPQLEAELDQKQHDTKHDGDAEVVAALAYVQAVEEKSAASPDRPIEDVAEEARLETIALLEANEAVAAETDEEPGETPDTTEHESAAEQVAVSPNVADDESEEAPASAAPPPVPPAAGGSGPGAGAPPPPRQPSPGSPGHPIGPGGPYVPGGPGWGAAAGNVAAGFPAAANLAPVATASTVYVRGNERTAMGQGLLIGGIVGYLMGRRRGRIKTEKKLMPIQKKLEKQVQGLHDMIAAKEQSIRSLAAEKTAVPGAGSKLAERLRAKVLPAEAPAVARSEKPAEQSRIAASIEQNTEARRTSTLEIPLQHTEKLGRLLVEAPGTVIAGAVAATAAATEIARGKQPDRTPVVRFDKKIESFTSEELEQAAEKVQIDGVSLKEMHQSGSINESGMRRVMAEFLQGGNVREVLSKEIVEKDLAYERDPKLRQAQAGRSGISNGLAGATTAAAGLAAVSATIGTPFRPDPGAADDSAATRADHAHGPVPDAATLKALRNRQMAGVATATIAIGAAIVLLIAMLG